MKRQEHGAAVKAFGLNDASGYSSVPLSSPAVIEVREGEAHVA